MVLIKNLTRPTRLVVAAVLTAASLFPLLSNQAAGAYGLVTSREMKLSTSQASATGVTNTVKFTAATTGTIKSFVFDFCSTSPIIGDTCTIPSGFSVGTPTVANFTVNAVAQSGWTFANANTNRTLTFTKATGVAINAGEIVTFDLTTQTNPSASNTSFYGRILTFPNDSGANSAATYTDTAPGTSTDAGGIAMSTADQITVQAKVQERLTFCVYTSAISYASCGSVSTTNPVILGDANGVLSPTQPSINKSAKYNVTTNASNGVTIRAKGSTLTSGSFTINPIAAGNATGATSTTGGEQFGFCTYRDSGGGTTGLTTAAPYSDDTLCPGTIAGQGAANANGANFGFDTTTANDNLSTTYGDTIASKAAGDFSTGILAFLGNISNTTEPGIYTTTMTFIATGNY